MTLAFLAGIAMCAIVGVTNASAARAAEPLTLEAKIDLGDVSGRIDHLAIDLPRQRLFVAELGNDSVAVLDLKDGKLIRKIAGLKRPQGVGYHQPSDTLYVANAGDGSVRMFRGPDYAAAGRVDLNEDADNVRIDLSANQVVVGYGNGALAIVDPESRKRIADIPLKAHPESFQIGATGQRIFVNVPEAREIAVIDRETRRQTASWDTVDAAGNFPMAIDEASAQVVVVFRNPARLRAFSMQTGKLLDELEVCGELGRRIHRRQAQTDLRQLRRRLHRRDRYAGAIQAPRSHSNGSGGKNLALCRRSRPALPRGSRGFK